MQFKGAVVYIHSNSQITVANSKLNGNIVSQGDAWQSGEEYGGAVLFVSREVDDFSVASFDGCMLLNSYAENRGGLFYCETKTSQLAVRNCILKDNVAKEIGGILYGFAEFDNCTFLDNTAFESSGVAHATGLTSFRDCVIKRSTAPSGSVIYSSFGVDGATGIEIDRSSFSDNENPAIVSTSLVVIRNSQGLDREDVVNVPVQGCDDSDIIADYCPDVSADCSDISSEADDTMLGFSCYCYPDDVKTDPNVGACSSSASMSDPVAGVVITEEDVWVYVNKPSTGRVDLQFSNLGNVRMLWELVVSSNPDQLVWNVPKNNGSLAAGKPWDIPLQVSSEDLQARAASYDTNFTLHASSPELTPIPESRSIRFVVHTVVSAAPNAAASYVDIINLANLTAAGTVEFDVTSVDSTGMIVLDAANVAYSAEILHSSFSASVVCAVTYDTGPQRHKGVCDMQGLLEAGDFELNVQIGSTAVGGGAQPVKIERCPDSFELSGDRLSCTCPAGRFMPLGRTIVTCDLCNAGTAKNATGPYETDCVACIEPEMSNTLRTACDACISGYYRRGDSCAPCPKDADDCTVLSDNGTSVPAPGFWRAGDEMTKVLECRFGSSSCPGDGLNQATGREQFCAPQYAGPLCAVCASEHFLTQDNECAECNQSGPWLPTIITGTVVVVCIALIAGACVKTGLQSKLMRYYKIGKTKGVMLIQGA